MGKIKVGDVYEGELAIFKIINETKCKYDIERTNKPNHPCSPNKKWVERVWKNCFHVDKLRKR